MENVNLNLNSSRSDKFSLLFSGIPSIPYVNEENPDEFERNLEQKEGYDNFMLGLSSVELPGLSHSEEKVGGQFSPVSVGTSTVEYDPLVTEIKIDANYYTYKVIYAWMNMIKNPFGYNSGTIRELETELFVDASLLVNDNMTNKPMLQFDFVDLRPITLPSLTLDYRTDDELTLSITWGYTSFELKNNRGESIIKESYYGTK